MKKRPTGGYVPRGVPLTSNTRMLQGFIVASDFIGHQILQEKIMKFCIQTFGINKTLYQVFENNEI